MHKIEVTDEQSLYCPKCDSIDIDMISDIPEVSELWKCNNCGCEFTVERRVYEIWEE